MRATQATRDHRETFTSKDLKPCEKFVGKDYMSFEVGIDDQYTQFFFSRDVQPEILDWVDHNAARVWAAIQELTFNTFDELLEQINKHGVEMHGEDDWEMMTKESKMTW